LNAKTDKTSACNALDKVVLDIDLPNYKEKLNELIKLLQKNDVNVQIDTKVSKDTITTITIADDKSWDQEFLSLEILIGNCKGVHDAIRIINTHSGGHSNAIMTSSPTLAHEFMNGVDSAAVYHNASTRFTDGGQMGVGAELAISTDKLHHRGPLGLKQLVTNKYFIFGEGQTR
ncbi:MAG: glutamate-5-semialdehyde dehydrogenase, partial [Bacteroidota bacterium]